MLLLAVAAIAILLSACQPRAQNQPESPLASAGVLDLSRWDFANHGSITLKGEWAFYWQKLLTPADRATLNSTQPQHFIALPASWNGYEIADQVLGGNGYATYHLKLKIRDTKKRYAIKLFNLSSAYALWVNDELVAQAGQVGESYATMQAEYGPQVISFASQTPTVELLLQVSNFHHRKGGAWNSLELGLEPQVRANQRYREHFDLFILGSLMIMAFYHFGLYALRRSDASTLYFGLFCLIIGLRSLFYREVAITSLLPELSWEMTTRLRYLTTYFSTPLFMMYVHNLYPQEFSKKALRLTQLTALVFAVIVLVTEAKVYSHTMGLYQVLTLLFCSYVLYVTINALNHKREGATWFVAGYITFFMVVIHDVLTDQKIIDSILLIPFGLFLFIFSQAFILSLRFSKAFARIETLIDAYERFVPAEFLVNLKQNDIVNVQLGDNVSKHMSVMFADIRAFTTLSENMSPQQTFNFLNAYLGRMEPAINQNNGFIDKYVGDEIMALFGESADDAVTAAITMLNSLRTYNTHRHTSGYVPISVGIGINTGELMLGTIGGSRRMESTVISDAVNLASRVEQLTKRYGVSLLISEHTYYALADPQQYMIRLIDKVQVDGKTEWIALYEVYAADETLIKAAKKASQAHFEQGVQLYHQGKLSAARQLFLHCKQCVPQDSVTDIYLKRTQPSNTHEAQ